MAATWKSVIVGMHADCRRCRCTMAKSKRSSQAVAEKNMTKGRAVGQAGKAGKAGQASQARQARQARQPEQPDCQTARERAGGAHWWLADGTIC